MIVTMKKVEFVLGTTKRGLVGAAIAGALCVASSTAWAGGVYLYEKSATDVGLGSAGWTARAGDASTIFSNPAGLSRLEGENLDVTFIPIYLDASFTPDTTLTTVSGTHGDASGWLPAGGVFYSQQLSDRITFGFAVGGYFGLAIEYEDTWVGRYFVKEAQLQALTFEPAFSLRINDHWSIGLGLAAHYGIFSQKVAINNTPVFLPGAGGPDGEMSIDTTDWTAQANIGVLWEGKNRTRVGLQYLSRAKLNFRDVPEFNDLRPALELFLGVTGALGTEVDLGMEMPQAVRVGTHTDIGDRWRLMGDIGWEEWSRFGKIDLLLASDGDSTITFDRNYQDVWHVGAGGQFDIADSWVLNFGAAYDSSMVEDKDRTPDLAVGPALRLGIGGHWQYNDDGALIFAYEAALAGDLPMAVSRAPLAGDVVGEYEGAAIHFLAVTWRKSF